jgi:hypothetical protein
MAMMADARAAVADTGEPPVIAPFAERQRTADRVFRGALLFNLSLTGLWIVVAATGADAVFFASATVDASDVVRILAVVAVISVGWGFGWYVIKNLLLKHVVGFSREERREAFSSRMSKPYDVAALVARYSERRIRVVDMIGRRGRFITLALASFVHLFWRISAEQPDTFVTAFLQDNLFDAALTNWIFLAFFYQNGLLGAAFWGPQSRVMDGTLARANALLIMTLWSVFKFVMVPLGRALSEHYPPDQFAVVFALIWGSYMVADALTEIGGALFGKQTIRVRGIGDVNRKSIGGTVSGFAGALVFCVGVVLMAQLPPVWLVLALVIAVSNSVLELFSPRGTDDFTMATGNALICWAFAVFVL